MKHRRGVNHRENKLMELYDQVWFIWVGWMGSQPKGLLSTYIYKLCSYKVALNLFSVAQRHNPAFFPY